MVLKILMWLVGGFIAFLIIGNLLPAPGPKQHARTAISMCWADQGKKSNAADVARFMAGACESMERDFVSAYGFKP